MFWLQIILPLLVSAFVGWLIGHFFTRVIFYPLKPVKFFGFTFQGIIPANKHSIAAELSKQAVLKLDSFGNIEEKIASPENFNKLKPEIEKQMDVFFKERLKSAFPMISMFIGDKTINQLKGTFMSELETVFPVVISKYVANFKKDIDIESKINEMIASAPLDKVASEFYSLQKKSLNRVKVFAAIIGFALGIIHVLLNSWLYS